MKRKIFALVLALCVGAVMMTGCGNSTNPSSSSAGSSSTSSVAAASDELNSSTPIDKDQEILVVSFGTSYNDSRSETIGAIEDAIAKAYPDYTVQRAFTSQTIIDKLSKRDGLHIDNVQEALDRAADAGVKTLIVQPTHLMNGNEYTDLSNELNNYTSKFENLVLGDPLLTSDSDYESVIKAITSATKEKDDGQTALVFMGHGTDAASNSDYTTLQQKLNDDGFDNYYIGTVEASPSVDDIISEIGQKGTYKKIVLEPLMVVAGDHANNDMAGDDSDSWKSKFEAAGYQVECIIKGLGANKDIQQIYIQHVQASIDSLSNN